MSAPTPSASPPPELMSDIGSVPGSNQQKKGTTKKKGMKSTKAGTTKGGAAAATAAAGARKKKNKEEVLEFDEKDPNAALPVHLRLYAKHHMTGRYHECKILERKDKGQKVVSESYLNEEKDQGIPGMDYSSHPYVYYIHYLEWDRRMDEWTTRSRMCLPSQLSQLQQSFQPVAAAPAQTAVVEKDEEANEETKEDDISQGGNKRQVTGGGNNAAAAAAAGKGGKGGKNADGHGPADHGGSMGGHGNFSEEDIKMHEEATKVKNIDTIVLGKYQISTWYYSPFPPEYNVYSTLHFCEFCLSFFGYESELKRHSSKCILRHPPGNEIYRSSEKNVTVAMFEIDGAREKIYCQNVCYIAKLFLDHKTLEFDTTPFLFYILCEVDEFGYHMVGYFSKEKISLSKFNLACILTLPCHQRKGYGKFLISFSYELSKIEEKVGSPEKPISDLGKVSYMSYWSATLTKLLASRSFGEQISIEQLSILTCITTDDIIECLKALNILVWYRGKWVFSETQLQQVLTEREEARRKAKENEDPNAIWVAECRPEKLHWSPYFVQVKKQRTQP